MFDPLMFGEANPVGEIELIFFPYLIEIKNYY